MALSIRERILVAIEAALAAVDGMDADRVLRNQEDPTDAPSAPILLLADGPHGTADDSSAGFLGWTLRPVIEGQAWAAEGENIGTALNALHAQVFAALMADPTWGGLAIDTRAVDGDQAGDPETGNPIGAFSIALEIPYWTKTTDLTALGPN